MTTTGELLVQLSDLATGTALEHLTNITGGGGTTPGPVQTVVVHAGDLELADSGAFEHGQGAELDLGSGNDLVLDSDADIELAPSMDLEVDCE